MPIDGQPRSIVKELDDMARTYIKGENAIILAVTPANADLATSDALHMAREVDPAGDRTIGELDCFIFVASEKGKTNLGSGCSMRTSNLAVFAWEEHPWQIIVPCL